MVEHWEGFLPFYFNMPSISAFVIMNEMATIQDFLLFLCALYYKPSSLAMLFCWGNVGKKGILEASAQLEGQQRGRKNQAAFTPETLPSNDFQSQIR